MRISSSGIKWFGLFSCLIIGPVLSLQTMAAAPVASVKMPKASQSLLLDIEQVGSRIVVVGERGHILVSQDQGETWVQANVPTAQMLTSVNFPSHRYGWAVGHDGNILFSSDSGETWELQRDGLKAQNEANISAVSAAKQKVKELQDRIDQANAMGDTVIQEPSDSESASSMTSMTLEEELEEANYVLQEAQDKLEQPLIAPPLMDVWFKDELHGWATGAFGTFLQTSDGGKTWLDRSQSIDNPDGYHLNSVVGVGGVIYIAGEAGFLIFSNDDGETWEHGNLDYDGTIFGLFAAPDAAFVIATGLRGNTFRSIDGGVTWDVLNSNNDDYSLFDGVVYGDNHIVMVGAGGSITVSTDGGESFTRYTLPARASLSAVMPLEGDNYMLVGQGGVYRFDVKATAE